MYKTFYTYEGLITKAENKSEALTKFRNHLNRYNYYTNIRNLSITDIHELNKTEVISLS